MFIINALIAFGNWFWGIPILILLGCGGLYVTIRVGFLQFRHFGYICSQTFGKMFAKPETDDGVSPFAAACTALASSIGASNIVGVPVAIALGGPGAVFWIWVMAFIGMATKYTEVTLGLMYREKNEAGDFVGGPYYYCRGLGKSGIAKKIGIFFGTFYAFGLMIELIPSIASQAASVSMEGMALGIAELPIAIAVAIISMIVCIGGVKRIGDVCDKLVPVMAIVYMLGALVIIVKNFNQIPNAFAEIFGSAFTGRAAFGGFAGASLGAALRWGFARGCYSNEAGMGTAPQGHAAANVDHPVRQGLWGVFEVTVDTIIVCTVTALAVLVSGVWTEKGIDAGALAQAAFSKNFNPTFANYFVAICVFLFVLSTIIVVTFYGQRQAEFLFGIGFSKIWVWVYIIATVVGGLGIDLGVLYSLTDAFLGLIIIPNMIAVVLMVPQVKKAQDEFFNTPGKYYLADKAAKAAKKAAK